MTILLHILAVILGLIILAAIIFVAGIIAVYPAQCFGIVFLLFLVYWLGSQTLGLEPFWSEWNT